MLQIRADQLRPMADRSTSERVPAPADRHPRESQTPLVIRPTQFRLLGPSTSPPTTLPTPPLKKQALRLRSSQMQELALIQTRRAIARLAAAVVAESPRRFSGSAESTLFDWIQTGVARARGYAIGFEADVLRFLQLRLVLGDDFDRDSALPWVQEILWQPALNGAGKIDAIDEHLLFDAMAVRQRERD